ncbi:hypothetical protein BCU68_10730 [Vibrio sp. 10N.286.49.B3]|uniref:hypothetical protein n=1 Tax=Vibrio sp. 10N.286.49.B3 TaxID=1880855 RepID=UPI000C85BF11|nr:hypothetical protein [Vibrio sp. 10N.286.49.B3]PMH45334.1 hypothetical protein BCU68_10730 [Vibrio sp. 10N.286.49.B3]
MKRIITLMLALGLVTPLAASAETGVGLVVGDPFGGIDIKHNSYRFNISLEDNFGIAANKTYAVQNTPLYLFIGGQYIDRNKHNIAITPGIGAEFRVKPVGFYVDLAPALYLDELAFELEAKAGFRVYF